MAHIYTSQMPEFRVDGQSQPAFQANLLTLECRETLNHPADLQVNFQNWGVQDGQIGFQFFNPDLLGFGRQVQVKIGTESIFSGKIYAVQGSYPLNTPPRIGVAAGDALANLQGERRTRTFTNVTLADLAHSIAAENSMSSKTSSLPNIHFEKMYQHNQTDLEFLLRLTRQFGFFVHVEDQKLVARGSLVDEDPVQLALGSDLLSAQVSADLRSQYTAVHITGWDPSQKDIIDGEADEELQQNSLNGMASGSSLYAAVFGPRPDYRFEAGLQDQSQGTSQAQAAFQQQAQRFVQVQGQTAGTPELRPGRSVDLNGLGEWFDGVYRVESVTHRFDLSQGFRTEFQASRPYISGYSPPDATLQAAASARKRARSKKPAF